MTHYVQNITSLCMVNIYTLYAKAIDIKLLNST